MRSERPIFSSSSTIRMRLDAISCDGQQHAKTCAAQLSFHQYNVPAAQKRALARDRKAQPHAALLKRNGGLKQAGPRLLAQPRPGIVHFNRDSPVGRRGDPENASTLAGGFGGV